MKTEQKILVLEAKLEAAAKRHTIGQGIIFPLVRVSLIVGLCLFGVYLVSLLVLGINVFQDDGLRYTVSIVAGLVIVLFAVFEATTGYRWAFKLGSLYKTVEYQTIGLQEKQAKSSSSNGNGSTKVVGKTIRTSQEQTLEDVKSILELYYTGNSPITRDNGIKILDHRKNSSASSTAAIKYMAKAGLIEKGSHRNDPWTVIPKSLPQAGSMISNYNKKGKK